MPLILPTFHYYFRYSVHNPLIVSYMHEMWFNSILKKSEIAIFMYLLSIAKAIQFGLLIEYNFG
jgi:hypothetical protein